MWNNNVIQQLTSSVISIEEELGLQPQGVYADVRTRLDILEARINNPYAPAPDVLNPFFIANTGVTIQAGFGDPSFVLAVPPPKAGSLFLREDGYNDQGLYSFRPDGYWHLIPTDPFTAAGDLSGTIYSQTVIGIQNNPVSNAAPSTGNTLGWNGSAWAPSALNLAGGSAYVTGQLPPANMGTITLTTDVVGSAAGGTIVTTVKNINGTSVPASPATNDVLVATSPTTSTWQLLVDSQISPTAAIQGTKILPNFGSQNIVTTGSTFTNSVSSTTTISAGTSVSVGTSLSVGTTISAGTSVTAPNVDGTSMVTTPLVNTVNMVATENITLSGSLIWPTSSTPNFGDGYASLPMMNMTYFVLPTQYNYFFLVASGSVGSTQKVVFSQNADGITPLPSGSAWVVQNNTTGGASIIVAGPNYPTTKGVTIANGDGSLVWTDGTNFYGA